MNIRPSNRAPLRGRRGRSSRIASALSAAAVVALTGTVSACTSDVGKASSEPYPNVTVNPKLRELLPDEVRRDGTLTIVTDPNYPPLEFIDGGRRGPTTDPIGADIDLGRAIAAKFGLRPTYEVTAFSNVVPAVAIQQFELGISALWADNPQASMVNMVTYYQAGTQTATKKPADGTTPLANGFCGQSVAVEEGTEYIDNLVKMSNNCTKAGKAPIDIRPALSQDRASSLLEDGKTDAMVGDSPTVQYTVANSGGKLVAVGPAVDVRPYGIAVSPRYSQLTGATQQAVQELIDSGIYNQILTRWQIDQGAVAKAGVLYRAQAHTG